MTTFSQLVDELVTELVRPDLKSYIMASLNQVIREVHTGNDRTVYRFASNRVEAIINVGNEGATYLYEIPNFNRFQDVEAIWIPRISQFAKPRPPGSVIISDGMRVNDRATWYQSGNYLAIGGYGAAGIDLHLSMFYYPRSLVYHKDHPNTGTDPRWAEFNVETETWTYQTGTPYTDEELRDMSTNWLLLRWTEMLREGVRSKVYKRLGDQQRAALTYSNYMNFRAEMQIQEIFQTTATYEG